MPSNTMAQATQYLRSRGIMNPTGRQLAAVVAMLEQNAMQRVQPQGTSQLEQPELVGMSAPRPSVSTSAPPSGPGEAPKRPGRRERPVQDTIGQTSNWRYPMQWAPPSPGQRPTPPAPNNPGSAPTLPPSRQPGASPIAPQGRGQGAPMRDGGPRVSILPYLNPSPSVTANDVMQMTPEQVYQLGQNASSLPPDVQQAIMQRWPDTNRVNVAPSGTPTPPTIQ